jgi:hypothetical protein
MVSDKIGLNALESIATPTGYRHTVYAGHLSVGLHNTVNRLDGSTHSIVFNRESCRSTAKHLEYACSLHTSILTQGDLIMYNVLCPMYLYMYITVTHELKVKLKKGQKASSSVKGKSHKSPDLSKIFRIFRSKKL